MAADEIDKVSKGDEKYPLWTQLGNQLINLGH
jgi:hypothetical protein